MISGGYFGVKARAVADAIPLAVHLELTHRCTCRCSFCYNPDRDSRQEMPTGVWVDLLGQLRALGALFITLTGGEPLLHPGFFAIAEAARRHHLALRVFTNGSQLDAPTVARIADLHPLSVELPVHGATPDSHDAATGTAGSFAAVISAVRRLTVHGVRPVLKMLLTRRNEAELDAVIALAHVLGATLRIDPTLTPRDNGDCSPLDLEASHSGLSRLLRYLEQADRRPFVTRAPDRTNCGVGRSTLAVDPFGEVYPCIQWRHSSLGNVRTTPLVKLWRESPARVEAAAASDRANDLLVAAGGPAAQVPFCPAAEALRTGSPLPARNLCSPFLPFVPTTRPHS